MNHLTTSAPCSVCGVMHTACGPVADVVPVDIPTTEVKTVTDVRLYDVIVNGYPTRMKLNDADAERMDATPITGTTESATVDEPANSDSDADTTPVDGVNEQPGRRARKTVPNRSRTAADNK